MEPRPHHLPVLKALKRRPMTDAELTLCHGQSPSNVRGRRGELVRMGLVEDSGSTRKTPGRVNAIVWRLTPAGHLHLKGRTKR